MRIQHPGIQLQLPFIVSVRVPTALRGELRSQKDSGALQVCIRGGMIRICFLKIDVHTGYIMVPVLLYIYILQYILFCVCGKFGPNFVCGELSFPRF